MNKMSPGASRCSSSESSVRQAHASRLFVEREGARGRTETLSRLYFYLSLSPSSPMTRRGLQVGVSPAGTFPPGAGPLSTLRDGLLCLGGLKANVKREAQGRSGTVSENIARLINWYALFIGARGGLPERASAAKRAWFLDRRERRASEHGERIFLAGENPRPDQGVPREPRVGIDIAFSAAM